MLSALSWVWSRIAPALVPILATTSLVGVVCALWLLGLYTSALKEVGASEEKANTRVALAIAETERATREGLEKTHQRELVNRDVQLARLQESNGVLLQGLDAAEQYGRGQDLVVEKLMLEASVDEIPDSDECLNVFVRERAISGLRLRPRTCPGGSPGGSPGGHQVCPGTVLSDGTYFPSGDFSEVTYGDVLKLWRKDRTTIQKLNAKLEAIDALKEESEHE